MVPDQDHVIGFVIINNPEIQKELEGLSKDGIYYCNYQKDSSLSAFVTWLYENGNHYAYISDPSPAWPYMEIECDGNSPEDWKPQFYEYDYEGTHFVGKGKKCNQGTYKELVFKTEFNGSLWLLYAKKNQVGSFYLKSTNKQLKNNEDHFEYDQIYHSEKLFFKYNHRIKIEIELVLE